MKRVLTAEMMDDPGVDAAELRRSLGYIRWVNRWLGGRSALLHSLQRWSKGWPAGATITLLDVATGSADLPIAAVLWGRQRGFDIRVTGLDVHEATLAEAARVVAGSDAAESIELVSGDALKLTERFAPGSFDYVHAGLFLHHLPEIEVLTVLRMMERVARRGIIWNDLLRTRLGCWVIAGLTVGQPAMVRHDSRVSVAAGFTRREVLEYRKRLGLEWCRRRVNWFTHRFVLAGEKPGAELKSSRTAEQQSSKLSMSDGRVESVRGVDQSV